MVTALIFGKPAVPPPDGSTSARDKEKEKVGQHQSQRQRQSRERVTTAMKQKPSPPHNTHNNNNVNAHNDHHQKHPAKIHTQRKNNSDSTKGVQNGGAKLKISSTPKNYLDTSTPTAERWQRDRREHSLKRPVSNNSTSRPPVVHQTAVRSTDAPKYKPKSNGEITPANKMAAAAAEPTKVHAVITNTHTQNMKMTEDEKWLVSFNELKENRRSCYKEGDYDGSTFAIESEDLVKWIFEQRDQYQKYLEGRETILSDARVNLLHSIGLLRCRVRGCRRLLGANKSFHCMEHRRFNTLLNMGQSRMDPSKEDNVSQSKRFKHNNSGETYANGDQRTLKSPPETKLEGIVNIVKLAADTVAKEIRYLGLQSPTDNAESAIRRFAVEIYCPMLYTSKDQSTGNSSHSADRVLLSTLLALRDMLIINAEKFFSCSLKDTSTIRGSGEEADANLMTRNQYFARTVVLNAAKALQRMSPDVFLKHSVPNQGHVFERYLEASRNYDAKGDEFQFALEKLDARATYRNLKGSSLSERESILTRTSFNYAREQHPLLQQDDSFSGRSEVQVVPNACAVFAMGESEKVKKAVCNVEEKRDVMNEVRESRIRLLKRYYGEL
jgi:hypothetical protein